MNDRWSDDHVETVVIRSVDRRQVESLIPVDDWLSGLDFYGFTDLT